MLIKPRTIPSDILTLHAALNRFPEPHSACLRIKEDLGKRIWGYRGEKSLDYYLDFLDSEDCFILHALKLKVNGHSFQIDTLLIFQTFTLMIEVKYWSGALEALERGGFRKQDPETGEVLMYEDPVQQVKHQQWQLEKWLLKRQLSLPPVEHLVIFTNSRLQIENSHYLSPKIFWNYHLLDQINFLKYKSRVKPGAPPLLTYEKLKITALLLKRNHIADDYKKPPIQTLKIDEEAFGTGVTCCACRCARMNRGKRTWHCTGCGNTCQQAHKTALAEYVVLFGRYVSSRELQKFLRVENSRVLVTMLNSLKVKKTGHTSASQYDLFSSKFIKEAVEKLGEHV